MSIETLQKIESFFKQKSGYVCQVKHGEMSSTVTLAKGTDQSLLWTTGTDTITHEISWAYLERCQGSETTMLDVIAHRMIAQLKHKAEEKEKAREHRP